MDTGQKAAGTAKLSWKQDYWKCEVLRGWSNHGSFEFTVSHGPMAADVR